MSDSEFNNPASTYKSNRMRFWNEYVVYVALIFFALFGVTFERNLFQKVEVRIINLLKEKVTLEAFILPLKLEDRFLFRPERAEVIAKKTFKMNTPSSDKVIEVIID